MFPAIALELLIVAFMLYLVFVKLIGIVIVPVVLTAIAPVVPHCSLKIVCFI